MALPTLRSAGRPRRRALPGPVRRVRSTSLTTAPAPVRRMKAQDRSRSFSASPLLPPCPGYVASNVSTATRLSGADSAGSPGCRQPGSPSPHSPACAGCRFLPLARRNTWRFPVSPCGSSGTRRRRAWQQSLLPRARRLNSRSGHLTLSLRGIMRLHTGCEQAETKCRL
jgi:hypothetical protein